MRPLAFKLLILALTVFLLLSFSLSAFAMPVRYWLVIQDTDEHPWPTAAGNSNYFIIIKTAFGIVLLPVLVKSTPVSNTTAAEKPNSSSSKNEVAE